MSNRTYLAIDLGAESGRTVSGHFDGERIELSETYRFPNEPVQALGTHYWAALRLWDQIQAGIAKTVAQVGVPTTLGVDAWGVDFAFLDANGALAGNPVQYRDSRTDGMMDLAFQVMPKADIYATTGLQFMKFNTLFQMLAVARRGKRDPFAAVDKFLFIPDLFNYFLTGVAGAEYTIASTSQMLDATKKEWATGLLEKLGIPTRILPALVATGTELGGLLPAVVERTGATSTKAIASAGHDTAAAVVGVPADSENWCYISSGTWSLMGVELPAPTITVQTLADNFTNEGGVDGTTRFLKNVMGLWLVQECRRSFERAGTSYDYAMLTHLAAEATPFGVMFNPDDDRFIKPADMPKAIRDYCKETDQIPPSDDGQLLRACLESLALKYRWVLERMEANTNRHYDVIHVVGGGSKNELLCQLTADCCQRPVIAGPVEATALGNILVQMRAVGDVGSLAEARELSRGSSELRTYEPNADGRWDEQYARFRPLVGG